MKISRGLVPANKARKVLAPASASISRKRGAIFLNIVSNYPIFGPYLAFVIFEHK